MTVEKVASQTKIFMGKKENLVKFILLVKYCFDDLAADLNLKKSVFQIDIPPSFLRIRESVTYVLNKSCVYLFQTIVNCQLSRQRA